MCYSVFIVVRHKYFIQNTYKEQCEHSLSGFAIWSVGKGFFGDFNTKFSSFSFLGVFLGRSISLRGCSFSFCGADSLLWRVFVGVVGCSVGIESAIKSLVNTDKQCHVQMHYLQWIQDLKFFTWFISHQHPLAPFCFASACISEWFHFIYNINTKTKSLILVQNYKDLQPTLFAIIQSLTSGRGKIYQNITGKCMYVRVTS